MPNASFENPTIVMSGGDPVLITKTITANGAYNAADDNADGYSSVNVNVGGSSIFTAFDENGFPTEIDLSNLSITKIVGFQSDGNKIWFKQLQNVIFPSTPSLSIENTAFWHCYNLSFATMPPNINVIDPYAFANCGFTQLTFLGTPTSIATTSFQGCTNLTQIRVPWAEGEVAGAPWGATNATITYNYTGE